MNKKTAIGLLCAATVAAAGFCRADDATPPAAAEAPDWKRMYEEQKKRTEELERRIAVLEEKIAAEPYVKTEDVRESTLKFLQQTELSGYVSASYFYNFNRPDDRLNKGRGFDTRHNEFMANKAYLALEKPVEYGPLEWAAGYKIALLLGQDAEFTQATGLSLGDNGDLFVAAVVLNVPVGNGLKLTFGKYETVHGYEANLTEFNYNWSGGLLWTFLEPFTHTGVKLSYQWTDRIETELLVMNGWDVVRDNNSAKSYMGAIYLTTPDEKTTVTLIGFGGPEQDNNSSSWHKGANLQLEHRFTQAWLAATDLHYKHDDVGDANDKPVEAWGAGIWLVYEPTQRYSVAVRGEWLKDRDGFFTTDSTVFPTFFDLDVRGQELWSVTLTLNVKPVEELRIAPEFRWDRSSASRAFDGHKDQITLGVGAAYFF
jgi:hypothetical protein